jgi:hypothetical protein
MRNEILFLQRKGDHSIDRKVVARFYVWKCKKVKSEAIPVTGCGDL